MIIVVSPIHSQLQISEMSSGEVREAATQHEALRTALMESGAQVWNVPLSENLFDSVFTKDSALLVRRASGHLEALMAHPRHEERQFEQPQRRRGLRNLGFEIKELSNGVFFEGGDLEFAPDGELVLLGHGIRSSKNAADSVREFLSKDVLSLELVHEPLFHLDLAFATLRNGLAFACRGAFAPDAWGRLVALDSFSDLVEVTLEEASRFALNFVEVNDTVIVGERVERIARLLEAQGKKVVVCPIDHFHSRRGGVACLTALVHPV